MIGVSILRLIVGQGLPVAVIGVAIGIAGAFAITRFMSSLLFGVEPYDPITFITMVIILMGIAAAASYIPARRAARIDPMVSLRSE